MIMNLNLHRNLYDLSNFYKYDNFFTIIGEITNIHKKVYSLNDFDMKTYKEFNKIHIYWVPKENSKKPEYVIIGQKLKYKLAYGHLYSDDLLVYQKVDKSGQILNDQFFITKKENLLKSNDLTQLNYFRFDSLVDINIIKEALENLMNIENQKYVKEIQNNLTVLGPLYDYDPKTGKLTKVTY